MSSTSHAVRRALFCLVVCLALAPDAEARLFGDFRGHRGPRGPGEARLRQVERPQPRSFGRQQPREQPVGERQAPRPAPGPVEGQGQAPAFQPAPPPADPSARPGRLTPDERRALRQQINEAGRDLYRPGRP